MSTAVVVIIVVVAVVVIGALVAMSARHRSARQMAETQVEAQHDDVSHHRDQARDSRAEAELAKERSERAAAEAELNERRAAEREQELESRD
jgi:hypothetical protein